MPDDSDLIVLGASARAAAFSALRAGLRPWCADLFADADLRARCPVQRLTGRYPDDFAALLAAAPAAPWLYVGGLENHPRLVACLARLRPLWGNDAAALTKVRDPENVARLLNAAGLPVPRVARNLDDADGATRWLRKPLRGTGIHFYSGKLPKTWPGRNYLQEYIAGEARAALYVAGAYKTHFLGLTRQLVGAPWLHAAPFQYCGSVGPLALDAREVSELERLGDALATGCDLRGLFGIDGIWRDGTFWPVEVNPRYTASVEVLEYATGMKALAWHRRAFEPTALMPPESSRRMGDVVGKAILFARAALTFPSQRPWRSLPDREIPSFADIPEAGERIESRGPILTILARAADTGSCLHMLRRTAANLDQQLFSRPSRTGG